MDIQRTEAMTMADGERGQATAARQRRFEALLDAHRGIVYKVAAGYARGEDERADLAQDIAAQLWRAFPGYDPQRSFSTWMYRIALNVAISHLRERSRHRDTVALDEDLHALPADDGDTPETAQRLRLLQRLIAQQPPLDRALLLLYLEDRGHREIADVLGLSETNVATKIGRLKQRLRAALAD
ncbi:RNA polymerase sigma factor (sigma-70 family) [Lysobacter enzymogenes]